MTLPDDFKTAGPNGADHAFAGLQAEHGSKAAMSEICSYATLNH